MDFQDVSVIWFQLCSYGRQFLQVSIPDFHLHTGNSLIYLLWVGHVGTHDLRMGDIAFAGTFFEA